MATPLPHAHVRKPNRPKNDFNFYFEAASVTPQPATSTNSRSHNSSKKKSSSSYASSYKNCTRTTTSSSSTSSTTSSTLINEQPDKQDKTDQKTNYIIIQGRRYWRGHGFHHFYLPHDDDESDRLMNLHYILKSIFQGNFTAPVSRLLEQTKKAKVLDIGCGAGTWILEMATEYPQAEFIGIDEYPGFPTHIKPSNSRFVAHNVLKGLPFEDKTFDFVYMRMMIIYFTPEKLSYLLSEINRVMKHGAYLEIVDTNYTVRHAGPLTTKAINQDCKLFVSVVIFCYSYWILVKFILYSGSLAERMIQQDLATNHPIFNYLLMASSSPQQPATSFIGNFIDICQDYVSLPLGWNDNQVCALHTKNFESFLRGLRPRDPEALALTQHVIDDVMDECERSKSQLDWFSCYARKPPMETEEIDQNTLESIHEFVEGFVDV
ncbi:S-adenosyl-L-methionine-dependent methyltransferase [Choanephora cucurbitarum]|nr:S-adenosyl-L-methionine-dependent methyltransferase [Choanephora cucurbitarum]